MGKKKAYNSWNPERKERTWHFLLKKKQNYGPLDHFWPTTWGQEGFFQGPKLHQKMEVAVCMELQVLSAGQQAGRRPCSKISCETFPIQNFLLFWGCTVVSYVNARIKTPHIMDYAIFKQQNGMISMAIARNWQACLIDLVWWESFWEK